MNNNKKICKYSNECWIYKDTEFGRPPSPLSIFRIEYCLNEENNYVKCKRYQIAEKNIKVPIYILPNSKLSIDNIINQMIESYKEIKNETE